MCGKPRAGYAMRHHLGVAKNGRTLRERRPPRTDQVLAKHDPARDLDATAGMDHAHHDVGFLTGEARQIGLRANDRERTLVDPSAVAEIVKPLSHRSSRRASAARFLP